jgi:4'-phosphopantetheinyl transferase
MIRVARPIEFPWLEGRFWEVPHQLGVDVVICRVELPAGAYVPPEATGPAPMLHAVQIDDRAEAAWYLASHAILRSVLASVLGESPHRLELTTGCCGKPRLAGDTVRFNMSRSGAAVLIGISASREIGVDIEFEREVPCQEDLARTHLAPLEYAAWQASGAFSRNRKFLEFWTRKEACVKAAGIGHLLPFDGVEVGCEAAHAPVQVAFRSGACVWSGQVVSIPVPSNLIAAAALVE